MAPKTKTPAPTNGKEKQGPDLPEGFTALNAQEMVGWWKATAGATIQGVFLGKFQGRGKGNAIRHYYQIRLTKRCAVQVREEEGGDWTEGMAEPGDVVGVDSKPGLRDLDSLLDAEAGAHEVYIVAKTKVELKSGNTMWKFDVGHREAHDQVPF